MPKGVKMGRTEMGTNQSAACPIGTDLRSKGQTPARAASAYYDLHTFKQPRITFDTGLEL